MDEYGIVYLLPDDIAEYHRQMRGRIEETFNLTGNTELHAPSHITLKYRFQAEEIQEVERVLREFSATQTKTTWLLNGFNYFANSESNVIFIDILPSPDVRIAHARLLDGLRQINWMQWGPFDNADLHYHITLAHEGVTTENFHQVWSFIQQHESPNIELSFDHLALLKISEEGATVYKQYWLGDGSAT